MASPVRVGPLRGAVRQTRPENAAQDRDDAIAETIRLTLEETPANATHSRYDRWHRLRLCSPSTITGFGSVFAQPHRSETFKLSTDPLFVDKVRDIVGFAAAPPDGRFVLCVDEKSQIRRSTARSPLLPMRPGQAERRMR